jgi:pimeloyl-ACP methyl ester carboxylesterase
MRRLSADAGRVSVVTPGGCGCLESSIVGCLFCCHCCSSERLGSQMAFFPPRPPTYALLQDVRGKIHARYTDGGSQITAGGRLAAFETTLVRTKRDTNVVVLFMDAPTSAAGDPRDAITLIVSHGNALDAAMFVPFGRRLRDTLGVNIVLYDYSGYGVSTGKPSARGVYADLEAVVDWCVLEKKFEPNRIVLYGQSIGSAPTCGYAAKAGETRDAFVRRDEAFFETNHSKTFSTSSDATRDALRGKSNKVAAAPIDPADSKHATAQCLDAMTPSTPFDRGGKTHHPIGGVVLVSPIMSGLNVVSGEDPGCCAPASVFAACDVFPNHKHAAKIRCPTLVVHGTRDVQVPIRHGEVLFAALSAEGERKRGERKRGARTDASLPEAFHPEPYWVKGAGHDDVYERNPAAFLDRIRVFLESVNRTASLRAMMPTRGGADFNAVRDSAERAREAAADAAGDVSGNVSGATRERASRNGGAPVRVMEMTRD